MLSPFRVAGAVALVLSLAAGAIHAGATLSFRQTTAKDFEEGEATTSVILPSGEVAPGLKASRVALDAAFVWSSALSPDGKTAYFGTGDQGRIYAVTPRQGGTAPAARKLADLDVPWVTSLLVRPDGSLLAGSTPGGRVFLIDPSKGEVKTLRQAGRRARLDPGPRRRIGHHLRRHRRSRQGLRDRREGQRQAALGLGRQAGGLACLDGRRRAAGRHLRQRHPLPGVQRRPRRGGARLRGRGGAGDPAGGQRDLRGGQRLRGRRPRRGRRHRIGRRGSGSRPRHPHLADQRGAPPRWAPAAAAPAARRAARSTA